MKKISKLYAFIVEDNGEEKILCVPSKGGPVPLCGANIERVADIKRDIADYFLQQTGKPYAIKYFELVEKS